MRDYLRPAVTDLYNVLVRAVRGLPTMPRERKLKVLALIEQGADEIAAAADPPSKITPGRPRVPPRRPNY
jgi:hypothetical protein